MKLRKIIPFLLIVVAVLGLLVACNKGDTIKVERGTISASNYINDSIGVTFTKPSSWRFYSDAEIAQLMNITLNEFKDKELINSSNIKTVLDFMAIDPATSNNVNLSFENLKASRNEDMDVREYVEISKKNLKEQMPSANYSFSSNESATLGGEQYLRLKATCSYYGVNMVQYLYAKKVGNYIVCITVTINNGESIATFEQMFS